MVSEETLVAAGERSLEFPQLNRGVGIMNWVLRLVAAAVALISVGILVAQGLAMIEMHSHDSSLGVKNGSVRTVRSVIA